MSLHDDLGYTSSISAFLDDGKEEELENKIKDLQDENKELKRLLKLLIDGVQTNNINDYRVRYAIRDSKSIL